MLALPSEGVPSGAMVMWPFSIDTIPKGWALCDGNNGTPDMRDVFPVGAGGAYAEGATGGSKDAVVVAHSHNASASTDGNHRHKILTDTNFGDGNAEPGSGSANYGYTQYAGSHSHSININSAGESGTDKNLPPYRGIPFIMKL